MATFEIPKTQKAAVLHTFKGEYKIETDWPVVQPSELKPGQCLVKLEYSGVCHSDLHIKDVDWGREPILPLVGGHEGVGVVVAIGEHTSDPAVKLGDRVGLKWIAGVCEVCEMCRGGHESSCPRARVLAHGSQMHGTFQQYAVSYVNYVTKIPDSMDSAAAAPILCAGMTVFKALKQAKVSIGQWVAIPGAGGGLGHLAIQYAVAQGLRVVAIDTGEAKRELALSLGAEKWVDFKQSKDLIADVKAATGGPGPQAALVATGDPRPFSQAALYLKNTGTLMVVGMPAGGALLNIPIPLLVAKSLTVIGSAIANRLDVDGALEIAALGKVKCRYETRNLEDINSVLNDISEGKIAGRVVLKI